MKMKRFLGETAVVAVLMVIFGMMFWLTLSEEMISKQAKSKVSDEYENDDEEYEDDEYEDDEYDDDEEYEEDDDDEYEDEDEEPLKPPEVDKKPQYDPINQVFRNYQTDISNIKLPLSFEHHYFETIQQIKKVTD